MKKYHVFISHAWKYAEHYWKVEDWLDEARSECVLAWENYSVPHHDPIIDINSSSGKKKLQRKLDGQIARASIVIILSGMYVGHSDWIEYEIMKAAKYGKYIIGVKPWGQEYVPQVVSNYADVMVEWNKSSIVKAMLESLNQNMVYAPCDLPILNNNIKVDALSKA